MPAVRCSRWPRYAQFLIFDVREGAFQSFELRHTQYTIEIDKNATSIDTVEDILIMRVSTRVIHVEHASPELHRRRNRPKC